MHEQGQASCPWHPSFHNGRNSLCRPEPFTAAADVTVTVTSGKPTDSFTITVKAKTVTPTPGDNKPGENKPGADKPKPNTPDEVAKTGASVTAVVFSALLLLSAGYLLVRKRRI